MPSECSHIDDSDQIANNIFLIYMILVSLSTVGYAVGGPLFQYAGVQAPFFLVIAVNMLIFLLWTPG